MNNTQSPEGFISTYNANTGAVDKDSLITGLPSPNGIALLDNTLYVSVSTGGVRTYNATSGERNKLDFTNLSQPYGLAIKPAP